ncbi:eukaryotic translation initiation factor eIF-2C4, putative [Talaromyces stipitatus ATCC 10500]|uniref:Eukaryotic translation initiation factor eIF-2C4, putative n=1 Tax=Talaromyces stipitatus (strain ATCC 10500 / CBS 375.48 / QM 6759 / NRRL 1006) TaxID=441959 RepID=B8M5N8_TALSN|nr:eukaryotic translation initiation factor eIF-2C4, putative [Talaromyces stipitatus ATCC 10500]EED19932.1 eukaryotic translation initiation factor eIF-2C4, putative [Talaromyces stipitatus ATCC 10500]
MSTKDTKAQHDLKGSIGSREADHVFRQYLDSTTSVPRPGYNTTGREVNLLTNAYPVTQFPTKNVYQYDITILRIGKEHESLPPRVRKFAWATTLRKSTWQQMIYDGNKLAWSQNSYDQNKSIEVNLNNQAGNDKPPAYRIIVRKSKVVNLQVLQNWLQKKGSFDERVLEALNFMDHLLREYPSARFTAVRRAFFDPAEQFLTFDATMELRKGSYQAIRPAWGGRLIVNVDSIVCAFWRQNTIACLTDAFLKNFDWGRTAKALKQRWNDPNDMSRGIRDSPAWTFASAKIKHLEVKPVFPNCTTDRTFSVRKISRHDANYVFPWTNPATGREEDITVANYYLTRYNYKLTSPDLPLVEMTTKDTLYPMECVKVIGLQRYHHRLNDKQTAIMINHAVRKPEKRFGDIRAAKLKLSHSTDRVLNTFGMKIPDQEIVTKGRLLAAPEIHFANTKIDPRTQGRWDLRGKKFLKTNREPLQRWGVGVFKSPRSGLTFTQADEFIKLFMKQYEGHGGRISSRPVLIDLSGDTHSAVERLFTTTANHFKQRPQLLLFVVPNKDVLVYHKIKKSCDSRFGVASQVLQSAHVFKKQLQYMSNVAMKVNAKLGGVTCKAAPRQASMNRPGCMIIGADVSHAAPGSIAASLTAISVSADLDCVKYMGSAQTGYSRVEMIDEHNMKSMLTPLVDQWTKTVGQGRRPQCIYYFRDGVSTGQFAQVLEQEVPIIQDIISTGSGEKTPPKVTVVIANKRHHIRFAAKPGDMVAGDKFRNPLPGTLVERDVTSPHDWDFLMVTHVALQGTAKPVHYHVIRDDMRHKPEQLQNMINEHCYQYVRSTTSVSLFPAVYYAHLISNRGKAQSQDEFVDSSEESSSEDAHHKQVTAPKPLMPMAKRETHNHLDMWFV